MQRLAPTVLKLGLPREAFVRLIDANRRDQRQHATRRSRSWSTTATFREPGRRARLYVFRVATPARIAQSNAVCTALQLLEHWQDVHEDYANGRIYLPAEDLQRFGVRPGEFEGDAYTRLLGFEIARARALLDEGAPLVGTLRGRARLAVAGYVGGGRAGLDALEAGSRKATKVARRAGVAEHVREGPVNAEAAYAHCRHVARASGSSFYAGMRLLPSDRRAALFAVYALARRIDDIADGELSRATSSRPRRRPR
jgi:phytoene/squalene synthetase